MSTLSPSPASFHETTRFPLLSTLALALMKWGLVAKATDALSARMTTTVDTAMPSLSTAFSNTLRMAAISGVPRGTDAGGCRYGVACYHATRDTRHNTGHMPVPVPVPRDTG